MRYRLLACLAVFVACVALLQPVPRAPVRLAEKPSLDNVLPPANAAAVDSVEAFVGPEVASPPRQKPIWCFPTTVGTRWVYEERLYGDFPQEWTEVVTQATEEDEARIVSVGRLETDGSITPTEVFRVTEDSLYRIRHNDVEDDPPLCLIRGQNARIPVYRPFRLDEATPVREQPLGLDLALPLTEQSWYTPGIGLVKRTSHPRDRLFDKSPPMLETVLKSFTPAKE